MKVLLLLGSGLGNIVQGTPCITALKYMGHSVSVAMWSSMPQSKKLLENYVGLDDLFFFPDDKITGNYDCILETLHARSTQFGNELNGRGKVLSTLFSMWGTKNDVEINLEAVTEHFNYDTKKMGVPKTFCYNSNLHYDFVIINGSNPADRWMRKRYPHMKELTELLPGYKFVCVGNEGEGFTSENVVDLTGKLALDQVMRIIQNTKLSICSDSGLSHVSAALGTETIVLFGFTDPIKCKPLGDHVHIIRKDLPCSPCQYNCNVWNNCKDWKCINEITPEEIKEKVLSLLK